MPAQLVPETALGEEGEPGSFKDATPAGEVELLDPKDIARLVVELLGDATDTPLQIRSAHSENLLETLRRAAREPGNDYVASLLTICLQITSGSKFVHISGVPGAGKTHAMVMLQLTFCML